MYGIPTRVGRNHGLNSVLEGGPATPLSDFLCISLIQMSEAKFFSLAQRVLNIVDVINLKEVDGSPT